jgi:hypothetical protein
VDVPEKFELNVPAAVAWSAWNGVVGLVVSLKARDLISGDTLTAVHEWMVGPLDEPEVRDVPQIAFLRARLEDLFGDLSRKQ